MRAPISRRRFSGTPRGARRFSRGASPSSSIPDRRPAAVAFVGPHNSGKTTLIVDLVPRLAARGLAVGTLKHSSRDAADDVEGKDSQRHAGAGARVAGFVTPDRTTSRRFGAEEPLDDLLSREFSSCDLVLVEGYKDLPLPKIEVRRRAIGGPPIARSARARLGCAGDGRRADDLLRGSGGHRRDRAARRRALPRASLKR